MQVLHCIGTNGLPFHRTSNGLTRGRVRMFPYVPAFIVSAFHLPTSYDVELPLEVDDEYWSRGFVQPLGKPSQLSYFVCRSRLCEVIFRTLLPSFINI
jgi:hypothetical protein